MKLALSLLDELLSTFQHDKVQRNANNQLEAKDEVKTDSLDCGTLSDDDDEDLGGLDEDEDDSNDILTVRSGGKVSLQKERQLNKWP